MNEVEKYQRELAKKIDEAIATKDFKSLKNFMKKWGPVPSSDKVLEITVYKLGCNNVYCSEETKQKSRTWLIGHGYKTTIWG